MRLSEPITKIWMKIDPNYQRQKCRLGPLVSGRSRRHCTGVPWRGGVKRQWGYRQRQSSMFSLAVSSLTMRPELLHSDTESLVGFPMITKHVTLNDLEWLFHVKLILYSNLAVTQNSLCVASYWLYYLHVVAVQSTLSIAHCNLPVLTWVGMCPACWYLPSKQHFLLVILCAVLFVLLNLMIVVVVTLLQQMDFGDFVTCQCCADENNTSCSSCCCSQEPLCDVSILLPPTVPLSVCLSVCLSVSDICLLLI